MAVRLKAALLAGIDAMFPDNATRYITPLIAREEFRDWVDSLLAGESVQAGSGINIDRTTPGVIRIIAEGGGVAPTYPTLRFGTSSDAVPTAGELTVVGRDGAGDDRGLRRVEASPDRAARQRRGHLERLLQR